MIILGFVGLSACGKTVVVDVLQGKKVDLEIEHSILEEIKTIGFLQKFTTATSRIPRPGEKHGVDYYFYSKEEFEEKIKNGDFVENAIVYGSHYGLPKDEVSRKLKQEGIFAVIMDPNGIYEIKRQYPENVISIYFDVSLETMTDRMKNKRNETEGTIQNRSNDLDYFYEYKNKCDYIINSDQDVNLVLKDVINIIKKVAH